MKGTVGLQWHRTNVLKDRDILLGGAVKSSADQAARSPIILPMKALVIGGSGLVGGALLRALMAAGHSPVATYRARPGPNLIQLDVVDSRTVRSVVDEVHPDVVFLT